MGSVSCFIPLERLDPRLKRALTMPADQPPQTRRFSIKTEELLFRRRHNNSTLGSNLYVFVCVVLLLLFLGKQYETGLHTAAVPCHHSLSMQARVPQHSTKTGQPSLPFSKRRT